ncbi:MAG: hypothetical protein J2P41_00200 [Blastocatellia bacterium]|nr:hypothetical protein [Blastocatellia bacterium]
MNPIKQIGRYKLPILSVVATQERDKSGLRRYAFWIRPGYDVMLVDGHMIHFTPAEKEIYDKEIEHHELVLQIYGMCRGMGLRG